MSRSGIKDIIAKLTQLEYGKYIRWKYGINGKLPAFDNCVLWLYKEHSSASLEYSKLLYGLLLTKVHLVKAMVFPLVMYGCQSCTIKKVSAEKLMLLNCGVGEDSWESFRLQGDNQSVLQEISPEYSLEGLMLKLKLQSFGHLMWRADSLEKALMKKDWRQKEKGMTEDEMVEWHH